MFTTFLVYNLRDGDLRSHNNVGTDIVNIAVIKILYPTRKLEVQENVETVGCRREWDIFL